MSDKPFFNDDDDDIFLQINGEEEEEDHGEEGREESLGDDPKSCNPCSNNTEGDQTIFNMSPAEIDKWFDEATNFSSLNSFWENGVNHAFRQFSNNNPPGGFTFNENFSLNDDQSSISNFHPIEIQNQAYYSDQGTEGSSLKSVASQVVYSEVLNLNSHVPHPVTFNIQNYNAFSSSNQFNMNIPQYSCSNPLPRSFADVQNSVPVPVPPPQYGYTGTQQFSGGNSSSKRQENSNRKNIYKRGDEAKNLRRYKHYNDPYENCAFFKAIQRKIPGNKYKDEVNKIGEKYNEDFKDQIKKKVLPKFKRDFKRNLGLAVWFFEEMTCVHSWLVEKQLI